MALLECRDLSVGFATRDGMVRAVNGVSFDLERGRCLGIVGESGSGKTQTCLALAGLLPRNARVSGSVRLGDRELVGAPRAVLREVRGKQLSMVFQDPMTGLTPHLRVGDQLVEVLRAHDPVSAREARRRALEIMERVQIPDPEARFGMYPFEFSGGMRQRVMIALALILKPAVVLADEPTTALDVTVQAEVLSIFRSIVHHAGTSVVLVTHDLGVVAEACDDVLVMYAGRVVEHAPVRELFARPRHPYTRALLACLPRVGEPGRARLEAIPGQPPNALALPPGCAFSPRCPRSAPACATEPQLASVGPAHRAACHRLESA